MKKSVLKNIEIEYSFFKEKKIEGRYIIHKNIEPILDELKKDTIVEKIGESFLKNPIYQIKVGTGTKRVLIWSQMHGNESTGTKAIFDFFAFIQKSKQTNLINKLLTEITFVFIPILNPDGALTYSRLNAQNVDLNRDVLDKKSPEIRVLLDVLHSFNPHYCFNLHDQRTIFSVGEVNFPATISLLAPSEDENRTVTPNRIKTMQVVVSIYDVLREFIPNQIGRFTDEFYPTATGDNFQKAGFPTILIEAGHFFDDYQREKTRRYNFLAIIAGFCHIAFEKETDFNNYFKIPEIKKEFFDVIYTNIYIENVKTEVGITYKEVLNNGKIDFINEYKIINTTNSYGCNKQNNNRLEFNSMEELNLYLTNKN